MERHSNKTLINPSLDAVREGLSKLANPQDSFSAIHIAGTNGKGSVCTFLELMYLCKVHCIGDEIWLSRGPCIGKYTSPHLVSVTERISINGQDISDKDFQALWSELFDEGAVLHVSRLGFALTYFEKLTVLAFEYFKRQGVRLAILEVGLGGRWDATNVIKPEHTLEMLRNDTESAPSAFRFTPGFPFAERPVAFATGLLATAITNIAMDHMDYLGDTLDKIRAEKEAIKKAGVPHFELSDEMRNPSAIPNSLDGDNFKLAKWIFEDLNGISLTEADQDWILKTFPMRYKGRFAYDAPRKLLLDGAHNPAAATELNKFIKDLRTRHNFARKIFILGFLDKDYQTFLRNLLTEDIFDPRQDLLLFTNVNSDRSSSSELVSRYAQENFSAAFCRSYTVLKDAYDQVMSIKTEDDLLVISGSLYLLGEFLELFNQT
jgi:dihydrofolate synthase/folylpolyglutamate synthase